MRKLLGVWALARPFPVIPLVIVLVVLIIPAIFAPLIAPYSPNQGNLSEPGLLPPFWIGDKALSLRVDTEIEPSDPTPQITLADARKLVAAGNARIKGGGDLVSPGDRILKLKTVVAETPPGGGSQYEIALKDAQSLVARGKMRIVGVDSVEESSLMTVSEGQQVEEIVSRGGNSSYLLGTDNLRRDILSRIIYGARISIMVAVIAILISGALGIALGISAGVFGGWLDALIVRVGDASLSTLIILLAIVPAIFLALALAVVLGSSFATVITVFVLLLWPHYTRIARDATLSVRSADVTARGGGAGSSGIHTTIKHILPDVFKRLAVVATLQAGFVVAFESALSFLGWGLPPPNPSWGLMVADGWDLIAATSGWWLWVFPGLTIMLVVLSMFLLGYWLRYNLAPSIYRCR